MLFFLISAGISTAMTFCSAGVSSFLPQDANIMAVKAMSDVLASSPGRRESLVFDFESIFIVSGG